MSYQQQPAYHSSSPPPMPSSRSSGAYTPTFPPTAGGGHNYGYGYDHEGAEDDDGEEHQGFETFSDFNNKGRYSSQRLSSYTTSKSTSEMLLSSDTVLPPSLSANDWTRKEAKQDVNDRTLRRRTVILEKRRSCVHALTGEGRWKVLVFAVFAFIVALGLTLYFVIPRVPAISFLSADPLSSNDLNATVTTVPAAFSFNANVSLAIDARESYVPVHFTTFAITLTEVTTDSLVATGSLGSGFTVPGKSITNLIVPALFSASYQNSGIATYGVIRQACTHIFPGTSRPTLSLILSVNMGISGVIGSTKTSAQLANLICPVEFSASAP